MSPRLALPRLTVWAGGAPLPVEALRGLHEVRVVAALSLPTQCDLAFNDPPGPLQPLAALLPGTALRLEVENFSGPLFSGEVTVQEQAYGPAGERTLHIRGYDLLHRLRKRQPVRSFVQVSLADLAGELAADSGLQLAPGDSGPALSGQVWQEVLQNNQSDLELLAGRAGECGYYLAVRERSLHLLTLAGSGPEVPLILGQGLLEARFELSMEAARFPSQVSTQGWNARRAEPHTAQVTVPQRGRKSLASATLATSVAASASQAGGKDEHTLSAALVENERHARLLAQAELDRRDAAMITVWGMAEGNPALQPGGFVDLAGDGGHRDLEWSGRYVLTSVVHTLDSGRGFLSEFSSAPPPPPASQRAASVELGLVTQVDDPHKLGLVRVKLPAFGALECGWMEVVSSGAGPGKGILALPEIGDRVLVIMPHGDPAQGIVLGGLYGQQAGPDAKTSPGRVGCYVFATRDGQRITLDDTRQTVLVENQFGSLLEITPQKVRILSQADLDIAAPGKTITIRADKIDFERA